MRHEIAIAVSAWLIPAPASATELSVLTYNVKGLPWPVASDRSADFAAIGNRLRTMRAAGRHPRIVVLQEAFTPEARRIGAEAGYRFRIDGPGAGDRVRWSMSANDRAFADRASWLKGEGVGKLYGSGLQILSDYPILAVRRMAFPAFACAGFDCLANKGVLLATVAAPGGAVTIATTHLNSRKSSGVSDARSLYAYRVQIRVIERFLAVHADPRLPIVFAGDFNVGKAASRSTALFATALTRPGNDALRACRAASGVDRDALEAIRRAKDWQFFRGGRHAAIAAHTIETPFGREPDGSMLSDHIGYTAHYRITSPVRFAERGRARRA